MWKSRSLDVYWIWMNAALLTSPQCLTWSAGKASSFRLKRFLQLWTRMERVSNYSFKFIPHVECYAEESVHASYSLLGLGKLYPLCSQPHSWTRSLGAAPRNWSVPALLVNPQVDWSLTGEFTSRDEKIGLFSWMSRLKQYPHILCCFRFARAERRFFVCNYCTGEVARWVPIFSPL